MCTTLQHYLGLDTSDPIIDLKMSIEDSKSSPKELLEQVKKVIIADKENLLTDFVDY